MPTIAPKYYEVVQKLYPELTITEIVNGGDSYADIMWNEFDTPPDQATLDAAVTDYLNTQLNTITKFQFRKLFTFNERVALDNFQSNTNIPANYKAILTTMFKDLDSSGAVVMTLPDVIQGVNMLEQLGLIGTGRAAQILARQNPPE